LSFARAVSASGAVGANVPASFAESGRHFSPHRFAETENGSSAAEKPTGVIYDGINWGNALTMTRTEALSSKYRLKCADTAAKIVEPGGGVFREKSHNMFYSAKSAAIPGKNKKASAPCRSDGQGAKVHGRCQR
jgi:hypothetical protein